MSAIAKNTTTFFALFKDTTQKNNIAVLDGVRAIACLSVIAFHIDRFTLLSHIWGWDIGPFASSVAMMGWSGVTLFFVLSGFLLFMPYVKALLFDAQWPSMRLFYTRRALRILPGYFVALLLLILLTQPQYFQFDHIKQLGLFLTFFMDSSSKTYQQIDGPFWTLAVEWQYYMLLPFLALAFRWVAQRGSSQRRLLLVMLCLLGMILWGITTRYWGRYYVDFHPEAKVPMPQPYFNIVLFFLYGVTGKFLEDFAVGMLVSTLFIYAQQAGIDNKVRTVLQRSSMWLWSIGLLWLLFMASWPAFPSLSFFDPYIGAHNWLVELGYALGYGLCVTGILFGPIGLQRIFEWPLLRQIGFMSYSLYIWHIPLLLWFMDAILPYTQGWRHSAIYSSYWAFVVLLIIPFSYLFYRLIEQPWMNIANKTRRKESISHDAHYQPSHPARV